MVGDIVASRDDERPLRKRYDLGSYSPSSLEKRRAPGTGSRNVDVSRSLPHLHDRRKVQSGYSGHRSRCIGDAWMIGFSGSGRSSDCGHGRGSGLMKNILRMSVGVSKLRICLCHTLCVSRFVVPQFEFSNICWLITLDLPSLFTQEGRPNDLGFHWYEHLKGVP
jgi:hypothetical protein